MKAIILAGGKGTRLPQSADNIPKPLVEINGKTILDWQIENLESQGFSDIRLSLGYMAGNIIDYMERNHPGEYEWVVEPEKLGTGGGLKFATKDLNEDFLALNVDDLADIDYKQLVGFHRAHNLPATVTIYNIDDAREFGLVDVDKEGIPKIQGFLEKPKQKKSGWVSIGHYVLNPQIFSDIKKGKFSIEYEVFPKLAQSGQLTAFFHKGSWKTVGTEQRLSEARENGIPL